MLRSGNIDFSMLKVWLGLEVRKFITATVDEVRVSQNTLSFILLTRYMKVERCVKYDQLSPNI